MPGRRFLVIFTAVVAGTLVGITLLFAEELRPPDLPFITGTALAVLVALITLWYVVPLPAKVLVVRQDELGLSDLIFYLVDLPVGRVPRDFLLQLHVAVANVGGKKAVISRVTIDGFSDASGRPVDLPGATKTHGAAQYRQRSGWRDGRRYFDNEIEGGPWLLAPDDVMTLRFRCRRGIDWSPGLELADLRATHEPLMIPFEKARGSVVWREGRKTHTDEFVVAVEAVQQAEYAAALRQLTRDFTMMPALPPQPFDIE